MPVGPQVAVTTARGVVSVVGQLDLDSAPLLRQVLSDALASSSGRLELDLAGVDFCDCSGLNVLLHARHRARERGKDLVLRAAGPAVERVLSLTGTLALFRTDTAGSCEPPPGRVNAVAVHDARESGPDGTGHADPAGHPKAPAVRTDTAMARGVLTSSSRLASSQSRQVFLKASGRRDSTVHRIAGPEVWRSERRTIPGPPADRLVTADQTHGISAARPDGTRHVDQTPT
ncbi:STAS domain-containing protein [Streptomyces sp. NPDC101237]|uniref:STAS domain-containing protein n=1 Tax=Streptomyces sp. NPDC101237 TaxID=3366139 RepID=UPI0037F29931